jgi:putative ABC transport system permease protein
MFTVIESVLLRPLPYQHSDRLVYVGPAEGAGFHSTSWVTYRDVREQTQKLETVALYSEDVGVVTPGVTPNVFKLLGIQPLIGRMFTEEEGQTGGPQVVLLSEGLWRKAFNTDQQIAGKALRAGITAARAAAVEPIEALRNE